VTFPEDARIGAVAHRHAQAASDLLVTGPDGTACRLSLLNVGVRGWLADLPVFLPEWVFVMASRMKRPVTLAAGDRDELVRICTRGVHPASMIRRARVLLALDDSAGEIDLKEVIAAKAGVSGETVRLVARRFEETGGDAFATIARKQREVPPVPSQVTGEVEARLIALACSQPPAGHARWSLRLLEKHVALAQDIPDMDHSTIGRVLKKRNFALI